MLDYVPSFSPRCERIEQEAGDEPIDLGTKTKIKFNALHPTDPFIQFQVLAPAYYDKNRQLVMGDCRGKDAPIHLIAPAPVLICASDNKQVLENMVLTPAYHDVHQKKWVPGDPRNIFMGPPAYSFLPDQVLDSESSNQQVQYQVLAPAYYDKHDQLVMGDRHGEDAPVYLVPPAPVLIRASYNRKDEAKLMSQYLKDMLLKPAYYHQKRLVIGDPRYREVPACFVHAAPSLVHGSSNQQESVTNESQSFRKTPDLQSSSTVTLRPTAEATVRMTALKNNYYSHLTQNESSQQTCQEADGMKGNKRNAAFPGSSSPILD